jgi:hypothetical protein
MSRRYFSYEEEEADKQGHNDVQHHRKDFDHDKYSDNLEDIAYWQGRQDEERKMRIEEEERQMEADREQREFERQMREEEIRSREQQQEDEDSDQQSVSDFDALMEREHHDMESQDDERPCSEEDLFRDILRDERED